MADVAFQGVSTGRARSGRIAAMARGFYQKLLRSRQQEAHRRVALYAGGFTAGEIEDLRVRRSDLSI